MIATTLTTLVSFIETILSLPFVLALFALIIAGILLAGGVALALSPIIGIGYGILLFLDSVKS